MEQKKSARLIATAMIGNALEFYDFSLFVFLAPVIGPLFFPSEDKISSILITLATVAVGYFMRPIGAIVFGYIGDIYGRKRALIISIILMAIPTFLIGIMPTYEAIGLLAPLSLVFLRLLQGFCTGGECNGAAIFVIENIEPHKAGFAGGIMAASSAIGWLMGSFVASLSVLEVMPSWGWRIAFLLGVVIGFVGLYLRSRIAEGYFTKILNENKKRPKFPLFDVLKNNPLSVVCTMGVAAFSGIMYNMSMAYVSIFLTTFQKWTPSEALAVMSFGISCYILLISLSGWLADKFGAKIMMTTGAIATLVGIYPFLSLLASTSFISVVIAQFILVILAAWFQGPLNVFMVNLFPPETRYSGLAFSYCIGMALFGGTTSMVATFLASWTGDPITPAYYVMFGAIIAFVCVTAASWKKQQDKNRTIDDYFYPQIT